MLPKFFSKGLPSLVRPRMSYNSLSLRAFCSGSEKKYQFTSSGTEDAEALSSRMKALMQEIPEALEHVRSAPDITSIWPNSFRDGFRDEMLRDINITHANALYMKRAFGYQNASKPEINRQFIHQMVELFGRRNGDTGSSEVQMAVLSTRIRYLRNHLEEHPKDIATRRNLEILIHRRRKIMNYLKRTSYPRYKKTIEVLGLRDRVKGWKKKRLKH